MEVSRKTALEIFGLKEDFTKEQLKKEFTRLTKVVHPDKGGCANLFRFVTCCKEELLNPDSKEKKGHWIDLKTLKSYVYCGELNTLLKQYKIDTIYCDIRLSITPYRNEKYTTHMYHKLTYPFNCYQDIGNIRFSTTIKLPKEFDRFKKFKVKVEYKEETFEFVLSRKNPFYTYDNLGGNFFSYFFEFKFE